MVVREDLLGEVMDAFFAETAEVDSDAFPVVVALQDAIWLLVKHVCPAEQQNWFAKPQYELQELGLCVTVAVQYTILRASVKHPCPEVQQS